MLNKNINHSKTYYELKRNALYWNIAKTAIIIILLCTAIYGLVVCVIFGEFTYDNYDDALFSIDNKKEFSCYSILWLVGIVLAISIPVGCLIFSFFRTKNSDIDIELAGETGIIEHIAICNKILEKIQSEKRGDCNIVNIKEGKGK